MKFEDLMNKSICIVVTNAEKRDDIHVYLGELQRKDDQWFFRNESRNWLISLDAEQLNRLNPVPENLKSSLLNADYFLPMTIQSIPGEDTKGYTPTNMQWHE
jgi:hypothetical protein